jgi:sugar/nucleoside kinase (ribokinase family)
MHPRVLCVGILVADVFVPPLQRLPPAGELVATGEFLLQPGGCAANVAIALAKLGVSAGVCGRVGDDLFGDFVEQSLRASGIDARGILRAHAHGTSKTVIVPVVGEDRRFIHTTGANAALTADDISATALGAADVVYVGGYLMLPALDQEELAMRLRAARSTGATVVLDVVTATEPPPSLEALSVLLPLADYFVPNTDEARALTGESDPRRQAERFVDCGARRVVIKLGDRGAYVRSEDGAFEMAAPPVPVVEASGAGDAFVAGLIVGILEGWELEKMVRFASVIGASACTALGCSAGVFTRPDAEAFLATHVVPSFVAAQA